MFYRVGFTSDWDVLFIADVRVKCMLIGLAPCLVGVAFALFAVVFACSHYISLGSCSAAAFLGVAVWFPILGNPGLRCP